MNIDWNAATEAETEAVALWGLALAIAGSAVIIIAVGILVVRASRQPFPASVVMSLTILAVLALVGYAVGGESRPELAAIAGTAVGALAGGVTALLGQRIQQEPPGAPLSPSEGDGDLPD